MNLDTWTVPYTIAVIRLIPIIFTFFVSYKHKRPLFMIMSGAYTFSVIANTFFKNMIWGGAFSTVAAYTMALIAVRYIIEKKL